MSETLSAVCLGFFLLVVYTLGVIYASARLTAWALRDRLLAVEEFVEKHDNYQKTLRDFYEGKIQGAYSDYWEINDKTRKQTLDAVDYLLDTVGELEKKVEGVQKDNRDILLHFDEALEYDFGKVYQRLDSLSETKGWAFLDAVHARLNVLSESIREDILDRVRAEFASFDEVYYLIEAVENLDESLDRVSEAVETIQERDRIVQLKLGQFLETFQTDKPNGE